MDICLRSKNSDAERLAYEGYALIARDAALSASDAQEAALFAWPRPCPLLRLALPTDLPPAVARRRPRANSTPAARAFLFAQLPELLPEWALAIWLRSDRLLPAAVSIDGDAHGRAMSARMQDVVPRAAFGALIEIDAAYAQLAADREATLAAARDEAAAIVAAAHAEAQTILAAARDEYEHAAARGYRDGEQRALADWVERLADAAPANAARN